MLVVILRGSREGGTCCKFFEADEWWGEFSKNTSDLKPWAHLIPTSSKIGRTEETNVNSSGMNPASNM